MDRVTRITALALGGVAAACGTVLIAPGAGAAPLTCVAPPGQRNQLVEGDAACGSQADPSSNAAAIGAGGVGFAAATMHGVALGVGYGGGTGAGEVRQGRLGAVSVGPGSVALGSVTDSPLALVGAGPDSQAFVGDRSQGVTCAGTLAAAVNVATGQGCFSDGRTVWHLP